MDTYIVRQPIMNREQKLEAYEIVYQQDSSALYNQRDSRVANAIVSFFSHLDATNFLNGKGAFLTFTPNLLMQNVPHLFDENKLVIQIEDNVLIHPEAKRILHNYQAKGFQLALLHFDFNKRYLDILPLADYMKVDFSNPEAPDIQTKLSIAQKYNLKTIAYNVNTSDAREKALSLNFDFFQGNCVAEMVRSKVHKVEHLQSNFFRLMALISREAPDFDEIAQVISLDVTLTFSLIRIVNSAYFALPNRVKDIKQALTVLGLSQLRHWVYLLSFSSDGGISDELIKTSFLRATFCQELSQFAKDFPISRSESYLLGMFSTLDVLLEVAMEDAVRELPIDEQVKAGLIGEPGKCSELLGLCVAYEKGEWKRMDRYAAALEIPVQIIAQKYLEAVEFVNETWEDLTRPY